MALIAAIIVLLIIMVRRGVARSESENFKQWSEEKIKTDFQNMSRFIRLYEDQHLEERIKDTVRQKGEEYKSMVQEIKDKIGIEPSDKMVVMALMALHRKIPFDYIHYGICKPYRQPWALSESEFRSRVYDQLVFLKWYDKNLKANGMEDDEMIFLVEGRFPSEDGDGNKTLAEEYRTEIKVADAQSLCGKICCWHGNANRIHSGHGFSIY